MQGIKIYRHHQKAKIIQEPVASKHLLPVPFQGEPRRADIFICLINPGISPLDYIVEEDSDYRKLLEKNLSKVVGMTRSIFSLDPKNWALDGGGGWWTQLFVNYSEVGLRREKRNVMRERQN